MRAPRLETIFSLSVILVLSFTFIYVLLYLMVRVFMGHGFEEFFFGPGEKAILGAVSMLGACGVLVSGTNIAISEQSPPPSQKKQDKLE